MTSILPQNNDEGCCHVKAYLTEREVAERLSMSVKWLQKMRLSGGGIPFVKIGASVRYPISALLEFERRALRASTSDSRGPHSR